MAKPNFASLKKIFWINPFIVSTPTIEVIEDNSEPIDEDDMTFLTAVLAQYNHNFHQQGLPIKCAHVKEFFNIDLLNGY
jgi:hypothetical protein